MKITQILLALLALILLVPFPAAAAETDAATFAKRTFFTSCHEVLTQELDMDDGATLAERGLRRLPYSAMS